MRYFVSLSLSLILVLLLYIPNALPNTCSTCSSSCAAPPASTNTNPGGGNPDDTFAVDSGFVREGILPLNSDPSVVTFQNGFAVIKGVRSTFYTNLAVP